MRTKPNKIISILMLLTGALLVGFSMGRWLAPLAAWIGPVLILRYARDHKVVRGYLLVFIACILAFLIGFGGIWVFFGLPMVPIFAILYGFLWSLPYLADRLMNARLQGFSGTFIYPLVVTALEFVNIRTNPVGAWGSTGFTQYGNLPLMQLASATGMIGITFLMGWFAAVVNWIWENRNHPAEFRRGLATFGIVFTAVFIFGTLRLNLTPLSETDETIRVSGITTEPLDVLYEQTAGITDLDIIRQIIQSRWEAYFSETVREAQTGAKVVIWPEGAGLTIDSDESFNIAQAQEVARENGIYLAIGFVVQYRDTTQPIENKFLLIDPTGTVMIDHIKYSTAMLEPKRLVGDGKLQFATTPFGVFSGVICWDIDYPTVIQQVGKNETGLMLVPSRDWLEADPIHSHMAVFRAIENGTSLVRQVEDGLSIAVDPYGRILAQTDFFGTTDHTLVAQLPTKHVNTIYTLFGCYFEWLCLIGFLYVVIRALTARRQTK
jgi:apolipoprotein N-acyltransferase